MIRSRHPADNGLTDSGLGILLAGFFSITIIFQVYLSGRSPRLYTDISYRSRLRRADKNPKIIKNLG